MNDLENRLTEALHARADLVQPGRLTPHSPPASVTPFHRRKATLAGATVAGLAAAAAVIALVAVASDDTSSSEFAPSNTAPTDSATTAPVSTDPAPTATTPTDIAPTTTTPPSLPSTPSTDLNDLLPADQPPYVEPGNTIALRGGATAVVEENRLVVTAGSGIPDLRGELTSFDPADALAVTQVSLGDAGTGYLVAQTPGGDSQTQVLYVEGDGGQLVPAEPAGNVPFGFAMAEGFPDGYLTWTTNDGNGGLYTRVQDGQNLSRFIVYRWQVTTPEGAGPEAAPSALIATRIGVGCFNLETDTVADC